MSLEREIAAPEDAAKRTPAFRHRRGEAAWLIGIVALAFVVRLAWILYARFTPTINDDAGRYDLLGRSLAHAAGYINPNGTTTLFWPPGYPFILAATYRLFGDSVRAALVLNSLMATATVALLYAIGRRAFGARVALAGAGLYALLPSAIFYANVTLSETAFTFVLLLGFWLLTESAARRSWPLLLAAGVALGYASLIRGQAALLPLVALPFLWCSAPVPARTPQSAANGDDARANGGAGSSAPTSAQALPVGDGPLRARGALLRALALGGVMLAVIAPWAIRNYVESRSPVLIATNAGVDFYIGHSAGADGRGRIVDELVFRYPELSEPRAEAKVSADGFREGLKYAAQHPLREVELSARKVFWLWYSDHEALRWTDGHGERHVLRAGVKSALTLTSDLYYWLLLALALTGIRRWLSFTRNLAAATRLLLVELVAYWTLAHVAFFADPRFHAPVMPVLCLWAAVAVISIAERVVLMKRSAASV